MNRIIANLSKVELVTLTLDNQIILKLSYKKSYFFVPNQWESSHFVSYQCKSVSMIYVIGHDVAFSGLNRKLEHFNKSYFRLQCSKQI